MQRWATLNPYVRALILAQDDRIYCSSAVGATDYSITEFHRWPRSMTPAGWLYTAQGTPMAPDRPAILLGVPGRDGAAARWWLMGATCRTSSIRSRPWATSRSS